MKKTLSNPENFNMPMVCSRKINKSIFIILSALFLFSQASQALSAIRIKDIAGIRGARQNQLVGYGLVVGLDGTGDDKKITFTVQSLISMLKKMGMVVTPAGIKLDNVAAVMVTATIPAFAKSGTKIDVLVSSIGNAESIQGGTLLMTPLKAADGEVYAVAQGAVSIGGFSFKGGSGTGVQKNHPTVGSIPAGAIMEKEVPFTLSQRNSISISLYSPDFTTSLRMANAINSIIGEGMADPVDAGTVSVKIPPVLSGNIVSFISSVENIEVVPDIVARVILNERTGTIVMGENVRISTVAVSHGNLSIVIKEEASVSQPLPMSRGKTVVVPKTEVAVKEQKSRLMVLHSSPSIGDVVKGLNAIGVSPRDLIAIIQAIKAAGALQAELEII